VTYQKDIQSLISDIDSLLPQADASVPWSEPRDIDNLYRVLVKLREFLVSLPSDNSIVAPENLPVPAHQQHQETGEQVVQVVTQQMNSLRADLFAHLQTDLEALRQQRQSLVGEIEQLEETQKQMNIVHEQKMLRQQQLFSEFSQELISRCNQSLSQKLAQILGNWEERLLSDTSISLASIPTSTNPGEVERVKVSREASEQLRQMHKHSDLMLSNLDANQRLIFEALQTNLESYQLSLSQSMAKMHNLGSQVEGLFAQLVERLVQRLLPPDLLLPTNQMAQSQQQLQTLLPNNDLSMREQQRADLTLGLMLKKKPLLGTQIRQQLPQLLEPISTQPESEINPVGNLEPGILNSQELDIEELYWENLGIELASNDEINTLIQLDIDAQEEALSEESLLTLTEDREMPSSSESQASDTSSYHQEIDDFYTTLFGTDALTTKISPDESNSPPLTSGSASGVDTSSEEVESSTGNQLAHLDEVVSDSLDSINETNLGESKAASDQVNGGGNSPKLAMSEASQLGVVHLALLEKLVPSTSAEDILFAGCGDPAAEVTPAQTLQLSVENPETSWEVLFFEDLVARESNLNTQAQTSSLATSSLITQELAGVETIAKLTDLLEQMGLNYAPVEDVADLGLAQQLQNSDLPASLSSVNTQPKPTYPAVKTESQTSVVEEPYIHASKDEILLVDEELDSTRNLEIVLDQNIMQQLSDDLDHFEEDEIQVLESQEEDSEETRQTHPVSPQGGKGTGFDLFVSPITDVAAPVEDSSADNHEESPTTATTENLINQQQPRFSRSDELLAEDWEELSLHNEGEEIKVIRDETSFNLSTSEASELIESNFEPDLFPPEIPELDQLNLVNNVGLDASITQVGGDSSNIYSAEEIVESSLVEDDDSTNIPSELLPIDDETFTEIFIDVLQDKPQLDSDSSLSNEQ